MSQVTIQNAFLSVAVDRTGAELASIRDRAGHEYLWQGDARFWVSRAPILFPIVGGLKEDCYTLDGQSYTLPKHGFARTMEFAVAEKTESSVVLTLEATDETRASFPRAFLLQVGFTLEGRSLAVRYTIDNLSEQTMYASIGAHEGYSCPEGIEAYDLLFEQEETLATCELDGNLLNGDTTPVLTNGSVLPLETRYFAIDALVFASIRSQSVTLARRSGGRSIRVDFPGFPSLGIWTKPGAPYLCIEPWCGLPDETCSSGDIASKRGILAIPGLRSLTRDHTISILDV